MRRDLSESGFHGYDYRILSKQGTAAKGGASDSMADGVRTRGFAFVAYSAEYRISGVMALIVNQNGSCVPEGPWSANVDVSSRHARVQPRRYLGASRLSPVRQTKADMEAWTHQETAVARRDFNMPEI